MGHSKLFVDFKDGEGSFKTLCPSKTWLPCKKVFDFLWVQWKHPLLKATSSSPKVKAAKPAPTREDHREAMRQATRLATKMAVRAEQIKGSTELGNAKVSLHRKGPGERKEPILGREVVAHLR